MRHCFSIYAAVVAAALSAGCAGPPNSGGAVTPAAGPLLQGTVARNGAVSPVPPGRDVSHHPIALRLRSGPDRKQGDVYIGQFSGTPVQEYHLNNRQNDPPLCALGGQGVNGIAVDQSGNLWVPNGTGGGQGFTQEYAPNCGSAGLKITSPNGQPADIAFDRHRNIYILNIFGASGAPGSVNVYDQHGTLTGSLTDSTFSELIGIAVDGRNDVFVSNRDASGNATVSEFVGGKMPGALLSGVHLGLPGAPQIDRAGNLIITDWESYTLNVYAPPYTGSPTVTPMAGLSLWCPLNRRQTRLYCADLGGTVDVYDYPSGAYAFSFDNGLSSSGFASGSAPDPASRL